MKRFKSRREAVREMRAELDRKDPDWREVIRAIGTGMAAADGKEWTHFEVAVRGPKGRLMTVVLLANPEAVGMEA